MTSIALVCGSFHKTEVDEMIRHATAEAGERNLEITEIVWVPGSMEAPLAAARLLEDEGISGVACLGIIEKGETQHGLAMGQAVIKSLIDLQLGYDKPIGLGIIGPGAEPHHIAPRLEPHARNAVAAIALML
ncbi:MAG TPA: 6,7-dimethyl-8-ribityllumazine synthase [Candidatus Thalassarchaeaceae archaeon]|nr:MAG TPA: 6,7-dimethyl-8-ribityllumazine synthase [Candidatus Poseidoniales archaeon]HII48486.1 6,7-dimethyl-8-ribityllumazine synthase [Candidatus Thalassarchaeaceae archaeon]|tara:strand:- start:208 stop:603 length:396 start_codon:yes stop_codon:yes gene_type:complete